jgi:hypothetical protein
MAAVQDSRDQVRADDVDELPGGDDFDLLPVTGEMAVIAGNLCLKVSRDARSKAFLLSTVRSALLSSIVRWEIRNRELRTVICESASLCAARLTADRKTGPLKTSNRSSSKSNISSDVNAKIRNELLVCNTFIRSHLMKIMQKRPYKGRRRVILLKTPTRDQKP